ncbi:MAG: gamma-glutamylcyclotransferase family protein [Planctomycetaceae bacterium]
MPTHLFVYGTLMTGESRHRYLAAATLIGAARTTPEYRLFDAGDYPALVADPVGQSIAGELWLVGDDTLRELDEVEGTDEGLYARVPVHLQPPFDKRAAETYIYLQSVAGLPEINGDWRERRR